MKFGSIAASRGRTFARACCGLNLRARKSLVDDGEDKGQENDAEDEAHEPAQPELSLQSFGEASENMRESRGVDSQGGEIARPGVIHSEKEWVNQRPPWAEEHVVVDVAIGGEPSEQKLDDLEIAPVIWVISYQGRDGAGPQQWSPREATPR